MSGSPYSTLHTPRLTLNLLSLPEDLPFRHELFLDWFPPEASDLRKKWTPKAIQQFLTMGMENHLKAAPNGPPQATYTVLLNPTPEFPNGQPIGGVNYFRRGEGTTPGELGFAFLRSHQKMGYGTEAIGEVLRHLRNDHGIDQIYACTMEDNVGCQKTMVKLGFVPGGWVEMDVLGDVKRLIAFVLPGMKDLEGQKLRWVGGDVVFEEEGS